MSEKSRYLKCIDIHQLDSITRHMAMPILATGVSYRICLHLFFNWRIVVRKNAVCQKVVALNKRKLENFSIFPQSQNFYPQFSHISNKLECFRHFLFLGTKGRVQTFALRIMSRVFNHCANGAHLINNY